MSYCGITCLFSWSSHSDRSETAVRSDSPFALEESLRCQPSYHRPKRLSGYLGIPRRRLRENGDIPYPRGVVTRFVVIK